MSIKDKVTSLYKEASSFITTTELHIKSNKDKTKHIIDSIKAVKQLFLTKFNSLIDDISSLNIDEKIEKDDEISPAAINSKVVINFPDGSNIYTHSSDGHKTFSCPDMLPASFEVKIKMNVCTVGYVVVFFF